MNSPYLMFEQTANAPTGGAPCLHMRYGQALSSFGLAAGSALARDSELIVLAGRHVVGHLPGYPAQEVSPTNVGRNVRQCLPTLAPTAFNSAQAFIPGALVSDGETELGLTEAEWEALGEAVGAAKATGAKEISVSQPRSEEDATRPMISLAKLTFSGNAMRRDRNGDRK